MPSRTICSMSARAFSIYVYTFHAIILPAGRGEAQVQAYSQDLRERVLRALDRGDRPTEIARRFEVSRIWVIRCEAGSKRRGCAPVFRSAAIAGPGWWKWNRCCAPGSQPSRILLWLSYKNGWRNKVLRLRLAPCGTS